MKRFQLLEPSMLLLIIMFLLCTCAPPKKIDTKVYVDDINSRALSLLISEADISKLGISLDSIILKQGNDVVPGPDNIIVDDSASYWVTASYASTKTTIVLGHTIYLYDPNSSDIVDFDTVSFPDFLIDTSKYENRNGIDIWMSPRSFNHQACDDGETKVCQIRSQYKYVTSILNVMYLRSFETDIEATISSLLKTVDEKIVNFTK